MSGFAPSKCEMSGFAPSKCEVSDFAYAKCEMSDFEPSKYAKCEVSGFAPSKCTVQIVPAPEHSHVPHMRASARASSHMRAHLHMHSCVARLHEKLYGETHPELNNRIHARRYPELENDNPHYASSRFPKLGNVRIQASSANMYDLELL